MLSLLILFNLILILSFFVIFSKNTITSMLSLIWCFILTAFIFLLLGAEFLTFTLIIVYGSAISILFLFVIMLLNLRLIDVYYINIYYIPLCVFITIFIIFMNVYILSYNYNFFYFNNYPIYINYMNVLKFQNNLYNFGLILYNTYGIFVLVSALILFIAMIGVIFLVSKMKKNEINWENTKRKIKNYDI